MFKYYGSKWRDAMTYQPPTHDIIVEPFAGAAAYSMRWLIERPRLECILVEKDPGVVALWHRLQAMTPDDILEIPFPKRGDETTDLLIALAASAASPLGAMKNQGFATVTERIERDWYSVRKRIAWTRGHIDPARITIIEGDYTDAPDIAATWFIDPPYQHQGHLYHYGSEGIDYTHLAGWATGRLGQVIVCEAHPAEWLPFTTHIITPDQVNGYKRELVWYSHPTPTLFDDIEVTP